MDDIVIRPAAGSDPGEILELLRELTSQAHASGALDETNVRRISRAMLSDPERYRNLVACRSGRVVGFIGRTGFDQEYVLFGMEFGPDAGAAP